MLSLNDITIGYPGRVVAHHLSARLARGTMTCLVGSNGAGKSTLLKTVTTNLPPVSGSIMVNIPHAVDVRSLSPRERARCIGVVLTERTAPDNMRVREMVAMGRSPYTGFWGRLSAEDERVVDEAMAMTGVTAFAGTPVGSLSDGERQKVMIAKALAQQTPVIFLDEPTAFLDFPSKVETMQLLLALCHDMGKIAFFSTHDVEIALQMSDRVWLMDKANGLNIGTPHELAQQGTIGLFVERPGVTFDPETLGITVRGARNVRK